VIAVIDSGMGNIGSVVAAFRRIGAATCVVSDSKSVWAASALILPGVGSFADGMDALRRHDLIHPIRDAVAAGIPVLGICLGMQMLAFTGEEFGTHEGLGLIPAHVRALRPIPGGCVPNMGWCPVYPSARPTGIFDGWRKEEAFYFAHSYHLVCDDENDVMATTPWGESRIVSAVRHNQVQGVQFHPEKSQDAGLELLHAFAKSAGSGGKA
jgi:glutamine amidotransferase